VEVGEELGCDGGSVEGWGGGCGRGGGVGGGEGFGVFGAYAGEAFLLWVRDDGLEVV